MLLHTSCAISPFIFDIIILRYRLWVRNAKRTHVLRNSIIITKNFRFGFLYQRFTIRILSWGRCVIKLVLIITSGEEIRFHKHCFNNKLVFITKVIWLVNCPFTLFSDADGVLRYCVKDCIHKIITKLLKHKLEI